MKARLLTTLCPLCMWALAATAENQPGQLPDSTATTRPGAGQAFCQTAIGGLPIVATGLAMRGEDKHFRCLRNTYMKEFKHSYDNYSQYLPAVVMLGMKAAGVESRDSWGRMIASSAMSAAIMGALVESGKRSTKVTRPDGSNNRSFPSGHTATAFMTATMLTKEYGHISPWIGVGAYTVATATGMMRVANNRHWVSDVLTGAGVGIISTGLGYYLADLIFKEKGIMRTDDTGDQFSRGDKPSFIGIYLGANIPLSYYDIDESHELRTSNGCVGGIEGAGFLNPYIGIGGRFTVANTHVITNHTQAEDNSSDTYTIMAGPYVSYPLSPRIAVGSKLLAGYIHYTNLTLADGTHIPHNNGACFGTGLSLAYKAREHYAIRLFLDYNLQPSQSRMTGEWMSTLAVGTAFGVSL